MLEGWIAVTKYTGS